MIRQPLGLRLSPTATDRSIRDQIRQAASIGARGVVLDATGDLAPDRLSTTGRRELRQILRSVELALIAISLPTRRPFDSLDQLDDRLARVERAFAMAYELGTGLVLAHVGGMPGETESDLRRETFDHALTELGRRADHRGVRFAMESGSEPGTVLRAFLDRLGIPSLAASFDPGAFLRMGQDPVTATLDLGPWIAHAYARDASGATDSTFPGARRGDGFASGVLDWEEFIGALEQVHYGGFLTVRPESSQDPISTFLAMKRKLDQF